MISISEEYIDWASSLYKIYDEKNIYDFDEISSSHVALIDMVYGVPKSVPMLWLCCHEFCYGSHA